MTGPGFLSRLSFEKQLTKTSYNKADIRFKGSYDFNYLISDLFWDNLSDPSFIYKKKNSIITFISSKINLTIINFDIVDYFRYK
jgi:hypothetical protein